MAFKQAIILRKDLGMSAGKLVAQGSHACVDALDKASPDAVEKWKRGGMEKICLKVTGERELLQVFQDAKRLKLPTSLIRDAGHTQIEPGTLTAVAVGPAEETEVDKVTGKLKLL